MARASIRRRKHLTIRLSESEGASVSQFSTLGLYLLRERRYLNKTDHNYLFIPSLHDTDDSEVTGSKVKVTEMFFRRRHTDRRFAIGFYQVCPEMASFLLVVFNSFFKLMTHLTAASEPRFCVLKQLLNTNKQCKTEMLRSLQRLALKVVRSIFFSGGMKKS